VGDIVDAEAIGFWFEHRQYTDKYYNYAMSVDEVERLTGFDFFASLPDNLESKAERMTRNFLVR
jgi:endonuclease G